MKKIIEKLTYLAENNKKGFQFAACIKHKGVYWYAVNEVTTKNDPTAHAEMQAIRKVCCTYKTDNLKGAIIYCSGEPCPMCLTAIAWAEIKEIYYINPYWIATSNNYYYDRPSAEVNEFLNLNRNIQKMKKVIK